jgi:diguanylate cyclase (GGDEF)-like protein
MITTQFTTNEVIRLGHLNALGILDTEPEERFDRITRLAKKLFNVPVALVSLVDEERQWFKSKVGIEHSETSREISFCAHAIHQDQVFIVENALQDKRFSNNPLVINEPHFRFYAGYPIKGSNGFQFGTLCIFDTQPHQFGNEEVQLLEELAEIIERELQQSQLSLINPLTQFSNRKGFLAIAQHSLKLSARYNIATTLAFITLINFQELVQTHSQAYADNTLIQFAKLLKSAYRNSDLIAQVNDSQFIVLFTDANEPSALEALTRVLKQIKTHNHAATEFEKISFSYGVKAIEPSLNTDLKTLIEETSEVEFTTYN